MKREREGQRGRFAAIEHAPWEMYCMRFLFALVIYDFMAGNLSMKGQPVPVGLAHFMDLSWFGDPAILGVVRWVLLACLMCYVAGFLMEACVPITCFLVAGYGGLLNSNGKITHHSQVIGITLLVLAVWYLVVRLRGRRQREKAAFRLESEQLAAHFARQAIVATYLVTALTKLWVTGFEWHKQAKYFPLQLEKTRMSQHYNRLGEEKAADGFLAALNRPLDGISEQLQDWFLASPNLGRTFLVSGLLLELFAFLALMGRRWGAAIGLLIVLFHLTISRVMSLDFSYNIALVLIFLVNVPYWVTRCGCIRRSSGNASIRSAA